MKIRFGSLEIDLEIARPVADVLEIKLKDLIDAKASVSFKGMTEIIKAPEQIQQTTSVVAQPFHKEGTKEIERLNAVGLTSPTLAMVATQVFKVPTKGKDLFKNFEAIEKTAVKFLDRKITDSIWALHVGPVDLQSNGVMTAAVGLTDKNQLVILAVERTPAAKLFQQLIARGLKSKDIKVGILSFHLGAMAEFKDAFPSAKVALDWHEFIDLSIGSTTKQILREAMINPDKRAVQTILKDQEGPKELLTYLSFPSSLWRALRTTAPIKKIEKELRTRTHNKAIQSHEQRDRVIAWSLARLQYHWYKIPVDAEQLTNLRYIQKEADQ